MTAILDQDLHVVTFPDEITNGLRIGLGFNNRIIKSAHGDEFVNCGWSKAKYNYTLNQSQMSIVSYSVLQDFYINRLGRKYRFLLKDPLDFEYEIGTQVVYIDDNDISTCTVDLTKIYADLYGYEYKQKLTRAKVNTIPFTIPEVPGHYEWKNPVLIDYSTGSQYVTLWKYARLDIGNSDPMYRDAYLQGLQQISWENYEEYRKLYGVHTQIENLDKCHPISAQFLFNPSNPNNYIFMTFGTLWYSGGDTRYRIEVYYKHTDTGKDKEGNTLELTRLVSGVSFYGKFCAEGLVRNDNPHLNYIFYNHASTKNNYWSGDAFFFRVIVYTTDVGGVWHGTSNGDWDTDYFGGIKWQEYTPWFILVFDDTDDLDSTSDSDVKVWVPGTPAINTNKITSVVETYVPVRFGSENQNISNSSYNNLSWSNATIVESGV